MAKNKVRLKPIPLLAQEQKLKELYPTLIEHIGVSMNQLTCYMKLQPSAESRVYKVKIFYSLEKAPKVWLIDPKKLAKVNGKEPHHIYDHDEEGHAQLCIFYPKKHEWNRQMYLAESFVPWIVTWLNAYEYWQITEEWLYPEASARCQAPTWYT